MTVGKFSESSDFSVIGNLPDSTIAPCIQYIPINGKVESKLNFLYTIYRVKKENKILYIVVARTKRRRRRAACQIFSSETSWKKFPASWKNMAATKIENAAKSSYNIYIR